MNELLLLLLHPFPLLLPPTYSGVNYDDWARKEKRKSKENRR